VHALINTKPGKKFVIKGETTIEYVHTWYGVNLQKGTFYNANDLCSYLSKKTDVEFLMIIIM